MLKKSILTCLSMALLLCSAISPVVFANGTENVVSINEKEEFLNQQYEKYGDIDKALQKFEKNTKTLFLL